MALRAGGRPGGTPLAQPPRRRLELLGGVILFVLLAILWIFSGSPSPPARRGTIRPGLGAVASPTAAPGAVSESGLAGGPSEEAPTPPKYRRLSDKELQKQMPPGATIAE